MRKGFEILKCTEWEGNADPYSGWCPNWSILHRGVQRAQRPEQRTNWWKLTFLCDSGLWEMDDRQMEGDSSMSLWQLRLLVETWETGKGISFPNMGVSEQQVTAMSVHAIGIILLSLPLTPPQLYDGFFLSGEGTMRKERGKGQGSANKQQEEESSICLENVNTCGKEV